MKILVVIISVFIAQVIGSPQNYSNEGSKNTVTLNYYYEILCPDCMQFDREQVCPTWEKFGAYFDVDFVPYGNAETRTDPTTGKVTIKCQHGEEECAGNIMHGCALKYLPAASKTNFICCTMEQEDPPTSGPKCAKQLGLDFNQTKICMEGAEGFELLKANGERTDKLNPPHTFVPWILFNGIYNSADMNDAQNDLFSVVCKYLQEPHPRECNEI